MGYAAGLDPVLDPRQLTRIEAVHRGFFYQHLYAVACLLTIGRPRGTTVIVERDEDVEVLTAERRWYLQVKTRLRPLQNSDISDALTRFAALRDEHRGGGRETTPAFAIVSNVEPGPELAALLGAAEWPSDITVISPGRHSEAGLPSAWPNIDAALRACARAAADVPFGTLAAETLVLKLAALVQHAAAGAREHAFRSEDLPPLLEQLLVQLQDFPDPPASYRPQIDEPPLTGDARLRLLTGFSGAGKTAWASQAALHCPEPITYYDVGDMPAASVANGLARELAARFFGGRSQGLGGALLAERGGMDVLRAAATELKRRNLRVTVVLDNAHRMSADAVRALSDAAPSLCLLLLGQPWDGQERLEAQFGIRSERLAGWSNDTIAAEFYAAGAPLDIETADRVARLTGRLPLYVQGAALVATSTYRGDADAFCVAVESRTHLQDTAQHVILRDLVNVIGDSARRAAALLTLSDVALTNAEALAFLSPAFGEAATAAASLRELRRVSIIIGYQGDRLGLHDALRPLLSEEAAGLAEPLASEGLQRLYKILLSSLHQERNIPRLNAVLRLLPRIGQTEALVDLATSEMFHEQGDQRTLRIELEKASEDKSASLRDRYWVHDALAYWESRDGGRPSEGRLQEMRRLVEEGDLGTRERLGLSFKEMVAAGSDRDRVRIENVYEEAARVAENDALVSKVLRYNRAVALERIGDHLAVIDAVEPLIAEYYADVGLRESDVFMKSQQALYALLTKPLDTDDLKRLADALNLWATARVAMNLPPMLRRFHAAKFYTIAQAGRSAANTLQEVVDDFLTIMGDTAGARETMERHLLPTIREFGLTEMILPVRSHYAIVLAWCGDITAARQELQALSVYGGDAEQRVMIEKRAAFVEDIAAGRVHLMRQMPPPKGLKLIPGAEEFLRKQTSRKVGRNEPCPCGSRLKYKKCHGKS